MDPKDEKELRELLEQLSKQQKVPQVGFLVHKNFTIHFILMVLINLLVGATTLGTFEVFEYPLVEFGLASFFMYMLIFTTFEALVKVFIFKYFMRAIILSFGLINLAITYIIFYLGTFIVKDIQFIKPNEMFNLLIFSICFSVIRNIVIYYVRKNQFERQVK